MVDAKTAVPFTACWNEAWDRAIPPGTRLTLSYESTDEVCMMLITEEIRIDVSTIIAGAVERMGSDPFIIHVDDQSLEYRF